MVGHSDRLTKTNIDRETLAAMQVAAAAEGISTTQLLDKMWLMYLVALHDGKKTNTTQA